MDRHRHAGASALLSAALIALSVGSSAHASNGHNFVALISYSTRGEQSDGYAANETISADGTVACWQSNATTLSDGPPPGDQGIFCRDVVSGVTDRVDPVSSGYLGSNGGPAMSDDGRYVAFVESVFVPQAGLTGGGFGDDGVALFDRRLGTTTMITQPPANTSEAGSYSEAPSMSGDGRYVFWTGFQPDSHGNRVEGLWRYDRQSDQAADVLTTTDGYQPNGQLQDTSASQDGGHVGFDSSATNILAGVTDRQYHSFELDVGTGTVTEISRALDGGQPNDASYIYQHALSADGRYVAYSSAASNIVSDDTNANRDVFVYDGVAGTTIRASVSTSGAQGYGDAPAISADGRSVAFFSGYRSFVPGDTNNVDDVFLRNLDAKAIKRISVADDGSQGSASSFDPVISADGEHVVFASAADNLVFGDANSREDLFLVTLSSRGPAPVATGRDRSIKLTWKNPLSGFGRVVVRRKRGDNAPQTSSEGTRQYTGTGHALTVDRLRNGRHYSFAIFTIDSSGSEVSRKVATAAVGRR